MTKTNALDGVPSKIEQEWSTKTPKCRTINQCGITLLYSMFCRIKSFKRNSLPQKSAVEIVWYKAISFITRNLILIEAGTRYPKKTFIVIQLDLRLTVGVMSNWSITVNGPIQHGIIAITFWPSIAAVSVNQRAKDYEMLNLWAFLLKLFAGKSVPIRFSWLKTHESSSLRPVSPFTFRS